MNRKIVSPATLVAVITLNLAILFSTCTPSLRLANVWKDPSYNLGPMKSMLVIFINKDPVKRRLWEDAFGIELSKHGVAVAPSYHLFPNAPPDTNQISGAVRQYGYNGALFVSTLPTQAQSTQVAPYVSSEPVTRYNPWRDRYSTRYVQVMHPGYVETSKIVSHEVDVWSTIGQEQMVWSGTCTIADPASIDQVADETAGMIVRELAHVSIISSK
jgi:hypothetical protein